MADINIIKAGLMSLFKSKSYLFPDKQNPLNHNQDPNTQVRYKLSEDYRTAPNVTSESYKSNSEIQNFPVPLSLSRD